MKLFKKSQDVGRNTIFQMAIYLIIFVVVAYIIYLAATRTNTIVDIFT
jgi:hypothetical protein